MICVKLLAPLPEFPQPAAIAILAPSADADGGRWLEDQLAAAGAPRGIARRVFETERGWRFELATYEVADHRLVIARYEFFDVIAAIAIRGLEPAWLAANESVLLAALCAVEPDWTSDEPLSLRELWSESSSTSEL